MSMYQALAKEVDPMGFKFEGTFRKRSLFRVVVALLLSPLYDI